VKSGHYKGYYVDLAKMTQQNIDPESLKTVRSIRRHVVQQVARACSSAPLLLCSSGCAARPAPAHSSSRLFVQTQNKQEVAQSTPDAEAHEDGLYFVLPFGFTIVLIVNITTVKYTLYYDYSLFM
jgi:hypothetical protein